MSHITILVCCILACQVLHGSAVSWRSWPWRMLAEGFAGAPSPRVSVINCPYWHPDATAGFAIGFTDVVGLNRTRIYLGQPGDGVGDYFSAAYEKRLESEKLMFQARSGQDAHVPLQSNVAVFASPESQEPSHIACRQFFLKHVQPQIVVVLVHEPPRYGLEGLKRLQAMHPNVILMALSPHVVHYTRNMTQGSIPVGWWLDALPFKPSPPINNTLKRPCERHNQVAAQLDDECLKGFVVQGIIAHDKRNWTRLWEGVRSIPLDDARDLQITIMGYALNKETALKMVPADVRDLMTVHVSLVHQQFMSIVRTMVGILPLWGSREYFVHRFSTNILTSLATGVPLVMSREAMKVYSFMDEGAVYLQEDGETEVQAMLRVQQAGPQLWRRTRAALLQLRGRIHARAVTCAQEVVAHADALASTGHPGPVAGEQSNLDQERIKACFSMTV